MGFFKMQLHINVSVLPLKKRMRSAFSLCLLSAAAVNRSEQEDERSRDLRKTESS